MFKRRNKQAPPAPIENQKWYVVFCDSDEIGLPFRWFTREGFRHCFCIAESPTGTLIMNYTDFHCEVRMGYNQSASDMAFGFVNAGCKVLEVHTEKRRGFNLRGFIYCVPLTKSFLGLRRCWAITPFSLHKWLKKCNLIVIDLNEITEKVMGKVEKPKEDPALKAQQQEELARAQRTEERLRQDRIAGADRARRQQTGIFSLISTPGGELGAPKTLLGAGK